MVRRKYLLSKRKYKLDYFVSQIIVYRLIAVRFYKFEVFVIHRFFKFLKLYVKICRGLNPALFHEPVSNKYN